MKLHLPCRLRAAVMALFATAVISAPAYAADSPVYWTKVNQIISDSGIATSVTLTGLGAFNGAFHYEKLANADLQNTDWTMTITGTGFNTPSKNAVETFPATFIGFTGGDTFPFSTYDKPTADTLSQGFILGFGYGSGKKNLYFGTELGWVDLGKVDAFTKEDISYELSMSYVGGKFSLNSLIINGSNFNLSNDVKDLEINMPAKNKVFTGTWSPGCLTAVTSNKGTSDVTLLSPTGGEAWHVNGEVTVAQWNFDKFEGPGGQLGTLFTTDAITGELLPVHFVGNTGIIMLDETYVANGYSLDNKLSAGVDMADLKGGCSFGFGAVEGATLTIGDGASTITTTKTDAEGNTTEKKETSGIFHAMSNGTGLRLYGPGNVIIVCEEGNTRTATMGATTINGTGTLTIQIDTIQNGEKTINMGDISAANASIVVDGDGALVIANTKGVNIKKLTAKDVTIAKGGTVSNLDVTNLTLESGVFNAGNDMLGKNAGHFDVQAGATLNVKKDMSVGTANIAGTLNAKSGDVWINGGAITVSGAANVKSIGSTYGCMLDIQGGALNASSKAEVYSANVSGGGSITTPTLLAANGVTVSGSPSSIKANKVTVNNGQSVKNDGITMTKTAAGNEILSGNVTITGDNITADTLAGAETTIASTAKGTLTITNMSDSSLALDTTSATGISKASKVKATAGNIAAASIAAEQVFANAGSKLDKNVSMTNVRKLNKTNIDVDKMSADTIVLSDITVDKAVINTADLTLDKNTVLNNVNLKGSTIKTHNGNVTLNEVKLRKNQNFADTFTAVDSPEVVLRGTTTPTSLKMDFLTINDADGTMVFPNSNNDEYTRYTILKMGDQTALDYAGIAEGERITNPEVVLMNISSYTRSYVTIEGDEVVIYGMEDKEGIVNELKQTDNQSSVMDTLNEVAEAGQISDDMKEIYDYVGNINLYTAPERQKMVSAAAGASVTALASSQRDGIYESQKNLRNRIIQMGGITHGPEGNMQYLGLQAWIQADSSFNTVAETDGCAGYDYDTQGGTVGFNFNLSENLIVGAAFSAAYGDLDAKSEDKGTGSNDAYYLNLFARYQHNRWTHMFLFTAGFNDMELERSISGMDYKGLQNVIDKTAKGTTDGYSLSAYYEAGYIVPLNEDASQILQPIFSLNLTSAHVNSYKEEGSIGNAGLEYEGVDSFYGQVGIGARYQAVIHTTEYERNAVLELRAQVVQNFGDATDEADVAFLGGGRTFTTKGTEVGTTGFQIGAGVSLPMGNQTTLFADADADFRSEATSIHANLGLRYDF